MKVIQIGANNGNDHVFDFLNSNKENIEIAILVEPIPFILDSLRYKYRDIPKVFIESLAIGLDSDLELYYEVGSNYEVSTFIRQHLVDHGCPQDKISSILVKSISFNSLCDKYNIRELDHLYIDTEGLDVFIIKSIDFSKIKIDKIYFESRHTDGANTRGKNYEDLCIFLKSKGYSIQDVDTFNTLATYENNI